MFVRVFDVFFFEIVVVLLIVYCILFLVLEDKVYLWVGEMFLVYGVLGGVGLMVVELGKVFGVCVIVCVSLVDKFEVVKCYGVDELFNF